MNNTVCGEPAFDNIDDILADKIIDHSTRHSGDTKSSDSKTSAHPSEEYGKVAELSFPLRAVFLIATLLLMVVLFMLFKHASSHDIR